MIHIAIQIRDLISSNVASLVECATNPAKLLKSLRGEIEESIIALTGDQTRARGRQQRLECEIAEFALREADWADKAALSMKNGREDLARAAIIERQRLLGEVDQRKAEASIVAAELAEIATAIAALEAKHSETRSKLAEVEQAQRDHAARACGGGAASGLSRTERQMHRIETLERRVDFATTDIRPAEAASAEAEIAAMALEQKVNAELDKLRTKVGGGKGKGKR